MFIEANEFWLYLELQLCFTINFEQSLSMEHHMLVTGFDENRFYLHIGSILKSAQHSNLFKEKCFKYSKTEPIERITCQHINAELNLTNVMACSPISATFQ